MKPFSNFRISSLSDNLMTKALILDICHMLVVLYCFKPRRICKCRNNSLIQLWFSKKTTRFDFIWQMSKVPILKESHFGKMKLWRVEHFYNVFVFTFGRDCYCIQQSRPKVKKICCKSVQPVRVSFFRSDILSKLVL